MCRPNRERGIGSPGGTSLLSRTILFHNGAVMVATTSNAKTPTTNLVDADIPCPPSNRFRPPAFCLRYPLASGPLSPRRFRFGFPEGSFRQGSGARDRCRSLCGIERTWPGGGGKAGFGARRAASGNGGPQILNQTGGPGEPPEPLLQT